MPRVLIAHPSADVYGSDRQMIESASGLRKAGWDVVAVLPDDGPLRELLIGCHVTLVRFPVLRKALVRPLAILKLVLSLPFDLVRLIRTVRRARPDLIYVNTLTIPVWVAAGLLTRRPVLVHVHEAEADVPRVVRLALAFPLLGARAVIANSNASAAVLTQSIPRLKTRISVVHNGVPEPAATTLECVRGRVALVARLSPRKGIDVALEAIAQLRREGREVSLEVCGTVFPGYEWYEAQLRSRASEPDLAGAVTFAGYVNPTGPVLARASVVIVPSRVEPFGNTAVEAMLAGRPVIVSAVDGLAEIVTDEVTGRLVAPADARALAVAISQLLDDPARAAEIALRGREEARVRFSTGRYCRDVALIASEILGVTPLQKAWSADDRGRSSTPVDGRVEPVEVPVSPTEGLL